MGDLAEKYLERELPEFMENSETQDSVKNNKKKSFL